MNPNTEKIKTLRLDLFMYLNRNPIIRYYNRRHSWVLGSDIRRFINTRLL